MVSRCARTHEPSHSSAPKHTARRSCGYAQRLREIAADVVGWREEPWDVRRSLRHEVRFSFGTELLELNMSPTSAIDSVRPYIVVAGADDGPDGRRVIEAAAASLANRVGGQLHILHLSRASELRSEATVALLEHGRTSLDQVATELHEATKCTVFVHIRAGTPWHEIVEEARRLTADLVVVGTHGRTGAARWLRGSQGEQVLRHAPCPVLFVRDVYPDVAGEVDAPCPACAAARDGADGDERWCERHSNHGVRRPDPVESRSEPGRPWLIRH